MLTIGKTSTILAILLFSVFIINGQNLFVFDQQTDLPVKNVLITSDDQSKSCKTDELGIADLSQFKDEDYINLLHPQYQQVRLSIAEIVKNHYRIGLAKNYNEKDKKPQNNPDAISQKEILLNNYSTATDMLSSNRRIYIQKNQQVGNGPMLMGFGANQLLYKLDGVRLNNVIFGNTDIPCLFMADVSSIELFSVIPGLNTGIMGNGVFGGTIDLEMTEPQFTNDKRWSTSGSGLARIGSADFEKLLHAAVNFGNDTWALLVSLSYTDFDDLKMGRHHNIYTQRPEFISRVDHSDSIMINDKPDVQKFSDYDQLSFISKIRQQFTENVDWTLSFYLTRVRNLPRYDRLLQYKIDTLRYAENYFEPLQWMMNSLKINFNVSTKLFDKATFIAAYQNFKNGSNERYYRDPLLMKRSDNVNILSAGIDFKKSLQWYNFINYGIDLAYNDVNLSGEELNIDNEQAKSIIPRYGDELNRQFETGLYFNYQKIFAESPFSIDAGIRLNYKGLKSQFSDSIIYLNGKNTIANNNLMYAARAGLSYKPDYWSLKLNLSAASRSPELDEAAGIYEPSQGKVVMPSNTLKPEYLYRIELNNQLTLSKRLEFQFDLFASILGNAIVRQNFKLNEHDSIIFDGRLSQIQTMVNSGNVFIYGTYFHFQWQLFQGLKFKQSLTYTKSQNYLNQSVQYTPPFYGSSVLTFEQSNFRFDLESNYAMKVKYENLPETERERGYLYARNDNDEPFSPSWWILNMNASYTFAENFILMVTVDNVFDYRYRPYAWGITAPGRNFIVSFKYSF